MKLVNNKEQVRDIQKALKENDGYCPCKLEKTPDTQCPCLEFRAQNTGECDCGLYTKDLS